LKKKLRTLKRRAGDKEFNLEYNMYYGATLKWWGERIIPKITPKYLWKRIQYEILVKKGLMYTGDTRVNSKILIRKVCREGYFLLPYNELAIAQGPKIQQKNKL
jgi:hypothetical protein